MNVQASALTPFAIREQLSRILLSRTFSRADYLRKFLSLCVSETLKGNGGCIKEIWLGGEVFGRRGDFNPSIDPIVRVQAGRLREKLATYYGKDGLTDRVRITVPVGSYVPVFSTTTGGQSTIFSGVSEVAIAILPLQPLDADSSCREISDTITTEITGALVGLRRLKILSRMSALEADFVIAGTMRKAASSHQISLDLTHSRTGSHCWSAWFDQRNTRLFPDVQRVAQMLKQELCEYGEHSRNDARDSPLPQAEAYSMSAKPRFM